MSARSLLGADGPQNYLDLIHQFQPKPTTYAEEKPFTDDTIHRACLALDVAASPFKVAGIFFPPLKAVGEAIGMVNTIILKFSNQDKMAEFAKRINAKITALSNEMDKGFDDLQAAITDINFLTEVMSPTHELYAAFTRYVASQSEADKEEFIDCDKVRNLDGLSIIINMHAKMSQKEGENLLWNLTKNDQYGQKKFEETVKYIASAMYQLYTAHTFYLMQQYTNEELDKQATRFITYFNGIVKRIEELNTWKESAYWNKDFLKPLIEEKTKGKLAGDAAQTISNWLTNTYTWDTFLVVVWDDDYNKSDDSYYKLKLSDKRNTLNFQIFEDRSAWNDLGIFNLIIHRFRAKNLRDPIDYKERHKVLEAIADRLENDRSNEFDVLAEAKIPEGLGFGFWSHFCVNNVSLKGRKIWHIYYAHSAAAKDEFYYFSKRTGEGGPWAFAHTMRANVLFATY